MAKPEKILLIGDLPCYGRMAVNAMLPILSHMGYDVSVLPTALVSNNFAYGKFVEAIYNKETKILTQKIYDKRGGNLLNSEVLDLSKPPRMANGYTWFGFGYEEQKDYYYLKSCNGSLKFPPKGDSAAHSYMNKVDEIWRIEVAGVLVVGAGIITGLLIKNGKIVETITKAAIIAVVGDKGPDVINAILNYHGLCREAERLFMEVPVV